MNPPRVVSVILIGERRDDILACLGSLASSTYQNQATLVVDYASGQSRVEAIGAAYPETQFAILAENRGYAGNNNIGIEWATQHGADWVLILNDDTVLAPDCIARLVEVGENNPGVGIVGPMVYHFDEPDVIQTAGGILGPHWLALLTGNNERDEGQYREPRPVEWISGCAMLARRELIEQVGLFDERFFAYWEEIDWCLRAQRAGWKLMQVPQAKLWHKGVRRHYNATPTVTYYTTRNRFLFLAKNHASVSTWLFSAATTLRTLSSWTLKPKWRGMRPQRDAMLQGLWDFARRRWGMRPS